MIYNTALELVHDDVFLRLNDFLQEQDVYLKMEGFSIGGSIKIKPALKVIARLELEGKLMPGSKVIESSSGNLGIALSLVCAAKGYSFTCVTDPNILPTSERLIQAYGADIIKVDKKDENGGYLHERIKLIKEMQRKDPSLVWINQYENSDNLEAHYMSTGPAIIKQFQQPDYVFIGAGTTGTLGGVSQYIRQHSPRTKIIAIDTYGSVTFGGPSGKRFIPGLGTSVAPPIRRMAQFDELILVNERDTVCMCHKMAKQGLLFGGSTGTVLQGLQQYSEKIPKGSTIVAISPDMGERYLNTLYDPDWLLVRFPELFTTPELTAV
ncbi:2,3-diaminopropionate biosynthesis protein SbnA [Pseudoalteromonas sp. OOF1S-7]|uniref:2,3-diaminopropionate biosynthesis protein SbnA n=1 Tax=Pseudoalteromonas sp. OOF1S-7 TaxID=2917757 RepID=UPI001EF4EC4B|nr:2,3-diaminopropionate biosynthesis protein SbnA [Pseudoalteromonas sp. OOF1S-7]MCG7533913.1 2,3-diaminopropionate biosynthesis protein SbnA [Pseudoalteromonas sp. OOF1S-7]